MTGHARRRPGTVVGERFEIEALAGAGGMGAVYRAHDRATGARVAVKVLLRPGSEEAAAREAKALAEVRHPAIVRHVAHGTTVEGEPYLAMEWLEGEDLGERLARGALSAAEGIEVALRIACGLAALHGRGIVHGDLKPGNVFLPEGRLAEAKLLDLGLARSIHAPGPRAALGTPGYLAPEQARGDADIDARADVFALGCVLFECLAGFPAFVAEHPMAMLARILFEEVGRLGALRPEMPRALDELVARMLHKTRDVRPVDGAAAAAELRALAAHVGGAGS